MPEEEEKPAAHVLHDKICDLIADTEDLSTGEVVGVLFSMAVLLVNAGSMANKKRPTAS